MATPDEIREAVSNETKASVTVKDRSYTNQDPLKMLEVADIIEAKSAPGGPFIRVGFKGRTI